MSGRLAEVDEEAHVHEIDGPPGHSADETSMRTVIPFAAENLKRLSFVWRVKRTQIRMMEDRNYQLTPADIEMKEKVVTPSDFLQFIVEKIPGLGTSAASVTAFWDLLTQTYVSKRDPQIRNMVVFLPFPIGRTFPTAKLNKVVSVVKRDPTIRYLDVIYEFPMTKLSRAKLTVTNRVVAEWSFSDLLMPVVQSVYVGSSFRVVSPKEFNEYYKADPILARSGLPILCRDDPLVRYHQWTVDTVVRSTEIGDVNVAVTRLLKDYVVSNSTIFAAIDAAEQPAA